MCLPVTLAPEELVKFEAAVANRQKIKRGSVIFREDDPFESLFVIRKGVFKTSVTLNAAHKQTMGFHIAGEIIGTDGLATEQHTCNAEALTDGELCVLSFRNLELLARQVPELQHHLYKAMGQEIARCQKLMLLLGNSHADVRMAGFLLELKHQSGEGDKASNELILPMSRSEIASYIGLKIETISRTLARFRQRKIIAVKSRSVSILDARKLEGLVATRQR